ncbi:hypothetical protein [Williamsoniiplasma luminosum]|uniref:Uncharacterized protein n=1 Tax=Williamsoniiplasma luminosum TaxID=214888 RepID=A0A2S0NKW4_9MOLU|nr:hypothetical protein [Williamsoniiplasma luminosum]AVP49642.1 MAG: hypothetical protein C5T88_03650 [Williamsoniiplasma luminosum]
MNIHNVNNAVVYDEKTFKYLLKNPKQLENHHLKILEPFLSEEVIEIPTISGLLNEVYPFIEKCNPDLIETLIQRTQEINKLVSLAINNKKGFELTFTPIDDKDKFINNLAKSIIYDINKLIYKFNISHIWANKTFINLDINQIFIGTIPIIATNKKEWFLINYKTSRSGYNQKYAAELTLQKLLFESNTKFKIAKTILLNPRAERAMIETQSISNYEKIKLEKLMYNLN